MTWAGGLYNQRSYRLLSYFQMFLLILFPQVKRKAFLQVKRHGPMGIWVGRELQNPESLANNQVILKYHHPQWMLVTMTCKITLPGIGWMVQSRENCLKKMDLKDSQGYIILNQIIHLLKGSANQPEIQIHRWSPHLVFVLHWMYLLLVCDFVCTSMLAIFVFWTRVKFLTEWLNFWMSFLYMYSELE